MNIDVQSIRQGSGLSTSTSMCDLHPVPDIILYWLPLWAHDIYLPRSLPHFVAPVHRNDCSWNLRGISCSPWFLCSLLPWGQDRKCDFAEYFEGSVGDLRKKWGWNDIHCCICRYDSVCSIVLLFIGLIFSEHNEIPIHDKVSRQFCLIQITLGMLVIICRLLAK